MKQAVRQTSSTQDTYFALQARWGVTKHIGGQEATDELARLCDVGPDSLVLVVGCGVGSSARHLATRYDAQIIGLDLSRQMVERATEMARHRGLLTKTAYVTATAVTLPFPDATFNAVISESVNSFIPDRALAVAEYHRVVKPGGFVGMNECVWLQSPPTPLKDYLEGITGAHFLPATESWSRLLQQSGLVTVAEHIHSTGVLRQWASEMKQTDFGDLVRAWGSFLRGFCSNAEYRRFAASAMSMPSGIRHMFRYFGYGIYVGQRPCR